MSVSAIVDPPVMTGIIYYFTHQDAPFVFGGAPFLLGGILMVICTVLAFYSLREKPSEAK